jgi:hypothetical protein
MKKIREEDARKPVFLEEEDSSEIKKDLNVYVDDSGLKSPEPNEGDGKAVNEPN